MATMGNGGRIKKLDGQFGRVRIIWSNEKKIILAVTLWIQVHGYRILLRDYPFHFHLS